MATDISAIVADRAFASLKAPIKMVSPPHVPVPFSDDLEDLYIPSSDHVVTAVREVAGYKG